MEAACQRQRNRERWVSRRGGFTAPSTETYLPARKTERAAAQRAGVNEMKMESLAQRISSRPAPLLKSQGSLERLSLHHGCILLGPALQRKHVLGAGKFVSSSPL